MILPAAVLEANELPPTLEGELMKLRQLATVLNLTPQNVTECEEKLRKKFNG